MSAFQRRMFTYVGDNLEISMQPELQDAEKPVVLVAHDESCFSSFEGKQTIWMEKDRQPLRPKGQGKSIMVSEFLCECHGRLAQTPVQQLLHPELVKQVQEKAIPIFKILHPSAVALFAFDNSQNHHAMAPDALVASRLNLSDGGKHVENTRKGVFFDNSGSPSAICGLQLVCR
uniref:Uncharacterized protein n=1 Tax=Spongospora subterranea TaxID=70186 RepID=A0A0H5QU55_9EUKA|eukprot:CRZ05420.1 hypothetical protein [Spongospora subterranea]